MNQKAMRCAPSRLPQIAGPIQIKQKETKLTKAKPRPDAPKHMRLQFITVMAVRVVTLTGCATRDIANVEVTPAVLWVVNDDSGRHCTTNRYASFVVTPGVPFTLDFSQHDSFTSPDTDRRENYFDGVLANIRVSASNTTALFSGRTDYRLHLGVTSSYTEEDGSLNGHTLRSYSTRFRGSTTFGHTVQLRAGEDLNAEPSVCLIFRQASAPASKFTGVMLHVSH